MNHGPTVVIPSPIDIDGLEVRRRALHPRAAGYPAPRAGSAEEAAQRPAHADVVFTSSPLTADDIGRPGDMRRHPVLQRRDGLRRRAAARDRGIPIWNCPTSNNEEVSDHAILLTLAAQRRLLPTDRRGEASGTSTSGRYLREIHRIRSRTIGIIGLGRIGHLVAQKLLGFRPTVIAYDPFVTATRYPKSSSDPRRAGADALRHLVRGAHRVVARHHRGGLPPGRSPASYRQRVAWRDRRRGRTATRSTPATSLMRRSTSPPEPPSPTRSAPRSDVVLTQHIAASSVESVEPARRSGRTDRRAPRQGGRLPAA